MKNRKIAIAAVAALLGGAMVPAMASAAGDYDDNAISVSADALSTIDAGKNGQASLTVHKYEQPDADTNKPNDGMKLSDEAVAGLKPLQGIKFNITRINNIDLTTQAGWEKVAELGKQAKADGAEAVFAALPDGDKGTAKEAETSDTGEASFTDLDLGLYYVEENLADSSNKQKAGITPAAPFFITVPLTNTQAHTAWVYDVHTYPKNAISNAEKSVNDDKSLTVGDTMEFTIDADIPRLGTVTTDAGEVDEVLKNYQIVDPIDERLEYVSAQVTLENGNSVTIAEGDDYSITPVKNGDKTYVTVEFTEAGRKKLVQARNEGTAATKVRVVITTTVKSVGDGEIKNTPYLIPNVPETPWDKDNPKPDVPGNPGNEVISKWGKVKITKVDSTNADKKLAGAEFGVKLCKVADDAIDAMNVNPGSAFAKDVKPTAIAKEFLPINKGGQPNDSTVVTADPDGEVTIAGLRHNDWKNNSKTNEGQVDLKDPASYGEYNAYCLIETKAPEGYELQANPLPFLVTSKTMNGTTDNTLPVTIKDVPKNGGFRLPKTGGVGVIVAVVAGGLLVGGGAMVALRNRRREDS